MVVGWLVVAVLFNPCLRVAFSRETWLVVDLVVGAGFLVMAFVPTESEKEREHKRQLAYRPAPDDPVDQMIEQMSDDEIAAALDDEEIPRKNQDT